MAPSGFGPYCHLWLWDAQTKRICVTHTPWVMTHALGLDVSCHSTSSPLRDTEPYIMIFFRAPTKWFRPIFKIRMIFLYYFNINSPLNSTFVYDPADPVLSRHVQ